jgi:hypothetical protein
MSEFAAMLGAADLAEADAIKQHLVSFLRTRGGVGALDLALAKGDVLAGKLVDRDHDVVRRHASGCGNARVDVFQQCKPRLLRPSLSESHIENN